MSSFDRTHRFVTSLVWEIPTPRFSELSRAILGGWQLSSVFGAETGTPFGILMSCADINSQGNNCRPNVIGNGALPSDQRSIAEWFNTSAFVIPSPQAYGDAGRNILRGPGSTNIDMGLSRSFHMDRNAAIADSIRVLQRSEPHQLWLASEFEGFSGLWHHYLGRACTCDPDRCSSGVLIMKSPLSERLSEGLSKQPKSVWMRYLLPVIGIVMALLVGGGLSLILPKAYDFPSALLFLVAIFVVAWFGGYAPGAIACVLTMALPLLGKSGSKLDFGRLGLLIALSFLISWVAQTQRRSRMILRQANDELDKRVQSRTEDLAQAVQALESEVEQRKKTEKRLQTQLERLSLLDQITRAIAERLDLRSIFQVVVGPWKTAFRSISRAFVCTIPPPKCSP